MAVYRLVITLTGTGPDNAREQIGKDLLREVAMWMEATFPNLRAYQAHVHIAEPSGTEEYEIVRANSFDDLDET